MEKEKRKVWGIVAIIVIVVLVLSLAVLFSGAKKAPTYNVAQVYITTWGLPDFQGQPVDVQFRVLLDLDGDRVYEVNRTSHVFANSTFELAPFSLGGPIDTAVRDFHFKIEVLKIQGGNETFLFYDSTGVVPENAGINAEGGSGSWSFPQEGHAVAGCSIAYAYYVN
jgi:hypothetical protein